MVKLGFTRAYGTSLRKMVAGGTKNRFRACLSGIGVTVLLQSATATTLLLISFVKKNRVPLLSALAVIIGADIATTLVAQVLVFDLSWLSPALLVIGIAGHMRFEHGGRKKHLFAAMIGVGLMLLSLALIRQAAAPLVHSETLPLILAPLEYDPVTAVLFSAVLTWVMHSSLAAVLLFASLAGSDVIDIQLGALLVLGANLGGAFIAFVVAYKEGTTARRITVGNIIMRFFTVILFAACMPWVLDVLQRYDVSAARHLVNLHVAFNMVLAALFLPSVQWVAILCQKIVPKKQSAEPKPYEPVYLDQQALSSPVVALASAARETLRMAEMVEDMLEQTIESMKQNTDTLAKAIMKEDENVDRLFNAIKLYLTKVTQESLDPKEADRYLHILTFASNLENVGDIIDKSLMDMAIKKIRSHERFSDEGWMEIKDIHRQVMANMKLAQTIFLSEDPALAQQLVENKKTMREAERHSSAQHFQRLREGRQQSLATTSLHMDIIRDYRRINSYLTSVAYEILNNAEKYKDLRRS
ncbi:MAG: Na/Pi cotransporter family protein [Alphaproteobacteria bacterium]|nr:Na/Pi cotransporter family protein [Alphaproteobacteria bacterium]